MKNPFSRTRKDKSAKETQPRPDPANQPAVSPQDAAMRKALDASPEKRIPVAARQFQQNVFAVLKDDNGVRVEDAIAICGAFAGHAATRNAVATGAAPSSETYNVLGMADGSNQLLGPLIMTQIVNSPRAPLQLIGHVAQQMGVASLPDLNAIFQRLTSTLGTPEFGVLAVPEANRPRWSPHDIIRQLWAPMEPRYAALGVPASDLPEMFTTAGAFTLEDGRQALDPAIGAELFVQSAVFASTLDPASLG